MRGNAKISWRVERRLCVKRMGGKGGATRSNATTSRGKQKANWRWEVEVARREGWEVEVARREAGARQDDGTSRGRGAPRG
jgi:hypothetical protein